MLKKIILIILLAPIFISPQNYRIEKLSLDNGVSLNLTYRMLVDHKGFLWFGTMFGLVKYDGENYKAFRHDPNDSMSISFDDIISLFEDNKGNIWIGTWGGGLNKFDPVSEKFTRYLHSPNPHTISSNMIWAITQDKYGNIWAGDNSGVLNMFNTKNNSFNKFSLPEIKRDTLKNKPGRISCLIADNDSLWICSEGKLLKYNLSDGNFDTTLNKKFNEDYINIIFKDSRNNYWIGAKGLLRINGNEEVINKYLSEKNNPGSISSDRIFSIAEDNKGNIWIGTRNGLNKFDYTTGKFSTYNMSTDLQDKSKSNIVNQVVIDKGGIIWTSTYEVGIHKIITQNQNFKNYFALNNSTDELSSIPIKAIAETKEGEIILGSYGSGLLKLDTTSNRLNYLYPNNNQIKYIKALAVDENKLWIGGSNGLNLFNLLRNKFENINFKNSIRKNFDGVPISSLMIDSKNRLWIGTDGYGLYLLNKNQNEVSFVNIKLDSNTIEATQSSYILTMKEDEKENVWIGTYAGLYKYNIEDSSIAFYKHDDKNKNSLSNNYVFSICEDNNGKIWVGTSDGLNKYNRQKNGFETIFEKNGLPNGVINSIVADYYGDLWISTNKGISKFDIRSKHFQNFDINDGLSSSLFLQNASLLNRDGKIYFGSEKSLCVFNPNKIKLSDFSPPVFINSLKYGNNEDDESLINNPSGEIKLDYNQNNIQINFASLDYSEPNKNLYKYKLEGLEKNWVLPSNNNFVSYKNLSPGEYKFIVVGSNCNGVWSKNEAAVTILISPPFWQTLWFVGLLILCSLILFYLLYRIMLNKKLKYTVEIEKIKLEERDKVRRKTAADFHDEIGHRLTRISILTELIKRKLPDSLTSIEPLLNKISENSAQLYSGTKDFIWSIEPKNNSLFELIIRLKDFGDDIFNDTNIHFEVSEISEKLKKEFLTVDLRRHLSLIFKEGMNNSLKYSNSKNVMLQTKIVKGELEILLADDGEGFSIISETKGNGLNNMKKRAEKIRGILDIDSRIGQGTKIIFKCKLPQKEINLN